MDPAQEMELAEIKRHRVINETIAHGDSPVQRFYDGAVVFITGGSGFLGKQLIEKLFRSCNIHKVFILIRSRKKMTIEERLKKILEDPVYDIVRRMKPDFGEKIIPVHGDVSHPDLGLSPEQWKVVTEEVTHIFHAAATINFVEPLKVATMTNVHGTLEMLKLGKACKNLKSYVHVSTAYAHATVQRIEQEVKEKFYRSPIPPKVLVRLVQELDQSKLHSMTDSLIKNWPNTYVFTKAVAEEAVRTESGDLPICIVRPAIVVAALREPSPGWIDKSSAQGPSGFILGAGLGVLHTLRMNNNTQLDLVPVDLVNNAAITAAYDTVTRHGRGEKDIKIYTVTGSRNRQTMGQLCDTMRYDGIKFCTNKMLYANFCLPTNSKLLFLLYSYLFHYIPAYIGDFVLRILGKPPICVKQYDMVYKLNTVLAYFMTNEWIFNDSNLLSLNYRLSPADKIINSSDMAVIDWRQYTLIWSLGIRRYILKDGLTGTKEAVKKYKIFKFVNLIVMMLYFYALYKMVYFIGYVIISLLSLLIKWSTF